MSELLAQASRVPGLELELRTDTQYATAYLGERPFATVRRRHAFDPKGAPPWRVWLTADGADAAGFAANSARSAVTIAEALARRVLAQGVQS